MCLADRSVFFILLYILVALFLFIGFPMVVYVRISVMLLAVFIRLVNAIFKENVALFLVELAELFVGLFGFALLIGLVYEHLIRVW